MKLQSTILTVSKGRFSDSSMASYINQVLQRIQSATLLLLLMMRNCPSRYN